MNTASEKTPMMKKSGTCDCNHHKMVPIIVILLGALFLLERLGVFSASLTEVIWPVLIIIGGFVMMGERKCGCC